MLDVALVLILCTTRILGNAHILNAFLAKRFTAFKFVEYTLFFTGCYDTSARGSFIHLNFEKCLLLLGYLFLAVTFQVGWNLSDVTFLKFLFIFLCKLHSHDIFVESTLSFANSSHVLLYEVLRIFVALPMIIDHVATLVVNLLVLKHVSLDLCWNFRKLLHLERRLDFYNGQDEVQTLRQQLTFNLLIDLRLTHTLLVHLYNALHVVFVLLLKIR